MQEEKEQVGVSTPEDADVDALVHALEADIRAYHRFRRGRRKLWLWRIGLFCVFLWIFVRFKFELMFYSWWLFGSEALISDAAMKSREHNARQLGKIADPRAVNILAKASLEGDEISRIVAKSSLCRVLTYLKSSDTAHVSEEGMATLFRLLEDKDPDLVIAILKAFEQIGSAIALPHVEHISKSSSYPNRVRQAALECLPFLHAHIERARLRTTLVRPAENPAPAESLLRSASSTADTPSDQLVRPLEQRSMPD